MRGQTLVGKVRHGVFDQARTLGQAQQLFAHGLIHLGGVVEPRTHCLGIASRLFDATRQRFDLSTHPLQIGACRLREAVAALFDQENPPRKIAQHQRCQEVAINQIQTWFRAVGRAFVAGGELPEVALESLSLMDGMLAKNPGRW